MGQQSLCEAESKSNIIDNLEFHPLLKIAVMLVSGMVVGSWSASFSLPVIWLSVTCVALFVTFLLRKYALAQSVAILMTAFLLGAYLMNRAEQSAQISLPAHEMEFDAVLVSEPVRHGKVMMCDLTVVSCPCPFKAKASILCDTIAKRFESLHVGDGIHAYAQLKQPENYRQTSFDYARWLTVHGYQAQTFIYYSDWKKAAISLTSLSYVERTRLVLLKYRSRLQQRLYLSGVNVVEWSIAEAMMLGDKSHVSKSLKDDYSISGLSHILAISGLHLAILYGLLVSLFRVWRRKWWFQLLSVIMVWAYVMLVGMPSSAVRAALMLTVYAVVLLLNRDKMSVNTLAFAAILMLLLNPMNLFDIGFQLSFAAVFAILWWMPLFDVIFHRWHSGWGRVLGAVCGIMAVSLAAQLGTAPLVAYYFGRFSCYFMLTNLIVVPCAYLLLLLMVLMLISMPIPAVQHLLLQVVAALSSAMNTVVSRIASLPYASIEGLHPSVAQVMLLYLLICCFYFTCRIMMKKITQPSHI